ncbi:hypothetical protein PIB30_098560 [Stylosanthes scabra]|uniref:Putative plant transposon protein domain-containing protein n=1 Tax=Stylosanthes scabra TaxID=79078 RepID=A0ABU6YW52_9FABA|nr:hypothetical protein [Stylosanthes scabra]
MASSSSVSVFDNHRFKTAFNEELYNTIVKNKKVIAECCIDLDEDEYPEIREQIALRGWRRLAVPKQEINIDLIHEFYANAIVTEEEMEEAGGHTFRSFVRGVPVDFSPENIRTLSTGQLRVPIQLRQQELNPVARGWHEFSIHLLIPSSNRFEIPVIRAILIHCIMRGEDIRAEDIIADKIVRVAQGIKEKGKLGFPSTIYKLCEEAGVPLREFRRTRKIQAEKPITARRMESTRLPRPVQGRQQEDEEEDEPMPQAGEQPPLYHIPTYTDQHQKDLDSIETQLQNMMWYQQQTLENISKNQAEYNVELRDIKGKQQELYENNDRFYNQVKQEQREMVQEIQQIKNYQVNQTLVDSTRHKAYLDELATMKARQEEFFSNQVNQYNMIRQDQKLLGKEILDVKKYQMSAVTMGSGGSSSSPQPPPPPNELDQALMKIREQHANFTEITRQLRDWTRNASIVKQIYDNIDRERPMFRGLLKSDLQPSNPAPPPSSSQDPKDPPSSSKDPKNPPK